MVTSATNAALSIQSVDAVDVDSTPAVGVNGVTVGVRVVVGTIVAEGAGVGVSVLAEVELAAGVAENTGTAELETVGKSVGVRLGRNVAVGFSGIPVRV